MEKEPIRISLKLFVVVILSVIALIIAVVYGWVNAIKVKNVKNELEIQRQIAKEANAQEIDINSDLVKKLYSYINLDNTPIMDPGTLLSVYREKITNETLENDTKIILACKALIEEKKYDTIKNEDLDARTLNGAECKVIKIGENYIYSILEKKYLKNEDELYRADSDIYVMKTEDIKAKAKEIFDTDINIEKHSYEWTNEKLMYDNNTYKYFTTNEDKNIFLKEESQLLKAKEFEDEIYLYDNYIKSISNIKYYNIYATSDEKVLIRKITNQYDLSENTLKKLPILEITLPLYKHTFKKAENGAYYWESTELTNKSEVIK